MAARVRILGVPIDALTRAAVLARCEEFFHASGLHHIVTANPELLLMARARPEVRAVVEEAALVVPDGVGLLWAARWRGERPLERIPGVDLLVDLCRLAARRQRPVALVGGRAVADAAAAELRRRVAGLSVAALPSNHAAESPPDELRAELARAHPAILFVAYGQPRQELWIAAHRARLEAAGVRVAMGVGGAFDMLAGRLPRAPRWMRQVGLEWLWRLFLEPRRARRVVRATIVFPIALMRARWSRRSALAEQP